MRGREREREGGREGGRERGREGERERERDVVEKPDRIQETTIFNYHAQWRKLYSEQ